MKPNDRTTRFKCQKSYKMAAGIVLVTAVMILVIGLSMAASTMQSYDDFGYPNVSQVVGQVLNSTPLIDGHNDLPYAIRTIIGNLSEVKLENDLTKLEPWRSHPLSHTDIPRMLKGGVRAQFWVAYANCKFQYKNALQIILEQIDMIKRMVNINQNHLTFATSAKDIENIFNDGKIASLIGVEGGHSIDSSLGVLRMMYELGVRYLTLTHTCNTPWADASPSNDNPKQSGLTDFGKDIVREMNRLGMMVDLSHTSFETMKDALKVSKSPVIFSHSSAYALCKHHRNVPDDILKQIAVNGGIVMVTFVPEFVSCSLNATLSDVADHIEHIQKVAGIDHVGIGGDYNGIEVTIQGLEDVSKYPYLLNELVVNRGWTKEMLEKLVGKNFLRVFRKVEEMRDEEKTRVLPSESEISLQSITEISNCSISWKICMTKEENLDFKTGTVLEIRTV